MPSEKTPFSREEIEELSKSIPTPFHIYNEHEIKKTARELRSAFSWVGDHSEGYQNFFAVKALPNPHILEILKKEGMGADCSSAPELTTADRVGISGEDIMFTSNDAPDSEFQQAYDLGAVINLDDLGDISQLEKTVGAENFPELISFRYNPGNKIEGNAIIGNPTKAKYGVPDEQIIAAYKLAREKGAKRFGLHTMMVSNERREPALVEQSRILFDLAARVNREAGIEFDFINLGGGIGIPYRPDDHKVNLRELGAGVEQAYKDIILTSGMRSPPRVVTESGRAITGPHGWLVSRVRRVADKYRTIVGVDACMANLMRPGMYSEGLDADGECYHHITVLGKEQDAKNHVYDVAGSLCESCDVFARQRNLPEIQPGDLIAIHDAGAHGHSMGFNYNAKLRGAEVLRKSDGTFQQIRRAATPQDHFATLDFQGSKYSDLAKK